MDSKEKIGPETHRESEVLVRIVFAHGNDNAIRNKGFDITTESLASTLEQGYIPIPRFFKDFKECEYYWRNIIDNDPMLKYTRKFHESLPFGINQELDISNLMGAKVMPIKLDPTTDGFVFMFYAPISLAKRYDAYFTRAAVYVGGMVEEKVPASESDPAKVELKKLCALNIIGDALIEDYHW